MDRATVGKNLMENRAPSGADSRALPLVARAPASD
jgi:hypothetical protein